MSQTRDADAMKTPVRLVCRECLRSVEWSGDGEGEPPHSCAFCGGPLEGATDDTIEEPTPLSLELTPEEAASWMDTRPCAAVPEVVGRFQIRELLGGGGFGQVYRAYDPRLDREVALKVLKEVRPSGRVMERFFREARAAAGLDHPNIVPLHDAGRDDGRCWIAYQFVTGPTLVRACEGRPLAPAEAARIVRALADALEHSHRRGIYHRDIKPANVILDEADRPRLTDFGLARRSDGEATLTREGTVLGTPAYMAPEQAAGRSHLADARSDLFSLGVVLYELLTGQRPADCPSTLPAWQVGTPTALVPPRAVQRAVPRALDRICRRALATDPTDRYPDAGALIADLDAWLARRSGRNVRWAGSMAALAPIAFTLGLLARGGAPPAPPRVAPDPTEAPKALSPFNLRGVPIRVAAPPRPTSAPLVGVRSTKLSHRPDCFILRMTTPENRLDLPGAAEAAAQGYRPCQVCSRPPTTPTTERPNPDR